MRNANLATITAFTLAGLLIRPASSQVATGSGSPNTGITPVLASFETGSSSSYITSSTVHAPYVYESLWQGTPAGSYNSLWAEHRIDVITESGMDVAAGSAASFYVTANSTNSIAGNYDKTNQAGIYANCSATANANVSCFGANFVAESSYNLGLAAQRLVGAEVDIIPTKNSVPDGGTAGPYSVGTMIHNNTPNSSTGLYGVAVDEIPGLTGGWAVGMLSANAIDAGVAVVKNNFSPLVGLYVGAATGWGMYVGCRAMMDPNLNTALQSACDSSHNPTIGVALGRTSNTTGASNKLRFESTNAGTEQDYDLLQDSSGMFHMQFSGADRETLDSSGNAVFAGAVKGSSMQSVVATGTAPLTVSSTTPVPTLTVSNHPTVRYCGTTATCANTAETGAIEVFGEITFPSSTTVALSSLPYTSGTTYACTAGDRTTAAGVVNATTYTDGAHVTFTETGGTNTDHARYHCIGY